MNHIWKAVIGVVIIVLIVFAARRFGMDDDNIGVKTRVGTVRTGNIERVVFGTGILRSARRADIVSEVKGKIRSIKVSEGETVTSGTVLAEIENHDIDNEIKVKSAAVEKLKAELDELKKPVEEQIEVISARLTLEQARTEYETKRKDLEDERAKIELGITSKYSKDEMERLERDVETLKTKMELAERRYEDAKPTETDIKEAEGKYSRALDELTRLEKSAAGREVKSPIDGKVLKVHIDKKALEVDPEKEFDIGTELFLIADLSSVVVEGSVFESDIGKLNEGQPVKVFLDPQSRVWQDAELTRVSLTPGKDPGKFDIRIEFNVPPKNINEGVRVDFQIVIERREKVLVVPVEFVQSEGGKRYVTVLKNGAEERREVKPGLSDNHGYQVLEGLSEGDKVVLRLGAGK